MATVADSNVEHLEWVDVLKGLGILTVVWGHSGYIILFRNQSNNSTNFYVFISSIEHDFFQVPFHK
ncbi:MAG: hypothetical protein WA125_03295 [Desulfosporosinus sp.]